MNQPVLSKAIIEATRFLEQVHDNVQELLNELIGQLESVGWRPSHGNRVSWEVSNKLDKGYWLVAYPNLTFLPKANVESRKARRMIAVCCMLTSADGTEHDFATFEASFVRFSKPVHVDDAWAEHFELSAYQACLGRSGPVGLSAEQYRSSFPLAESVSTIMLPLCELTSAGVLQAKIVAPLLALEAKP